MSYAAAIRDLRTGANSLFSAFTEKQSIWLTLWSEESRTQSFKPLNQKSSGLASTYGIVASLPIGESYSMNDSSVMLESIEKVFSDSATDLARILRVSRPMIYHYRQGMEPAIENKRRLQLLSNLANDFLPLISNPLKSELKKEQPDGGTLLAYLSDEELDIVALRQIISRQLGIIDKSIRSQLASTLANIQLTKDRTDIMEERQTEVKMLYFGDAQNPGKLIQQHPNGQRVRGRMIKRKFVPDYE
ncbi:MAG: hypothetical protein ABSB19_06770 [Methylomonas sp.]|jgi:hypothetical protein